MFTERPVNDPPAVSHQAAPFPVVRTQHDGKQQEYSDAAGIDCEAGPEPKTRQEFKSEVDVNTILKRFGVGALAQRPGQLQYGEMDYDLDLQQGIAALKAAESAFRRLPKEMQELYGKPSEMLDAIQSNQFAQDWKDVQKEKGAPAPTPPEVTPK